MVPLAIAYTRGKEVLVVFSTYGWYAEGLSVIFLSVLAINAGIWLVEMVKQRRLDAIANAPPSDAIPEATSPRAVARPATHRVSQ